MLIHIEVALFKLLVWPHEVEPWFHSWYRGRVETLDAKYTIPHICVTQLIPCNTDLIIVIREYVSTQRGRSSCHHWTGPSLPRLRESGYFHQEGMSVFVLFKSHQGQSQ